MLLTTEGPGTYVSATSCLQSVLLLRLDDYVDRSVAQLNVMREYAPMKPSGTISELTMTFRDVSLNTPEEMLNGAAMKTAEKSAKRASILLETSSETSTKTSIDSSTDSSTDSSIEKSIEKSIESPKKISLNSSLKSSKMFVDQSTVTTSETTISPLIADVLLFDNDNLRAVLSNLTELEGFYAPKRSFQLRLLRYEREREREFGREIRKIYSHF